MTEILSEAHNDFLNTFSEESIPWLGYTSSQNWAGKWKWYSPTTGKTFPGRVRKVRSIKLQKPFLILHEFYICL